MYDPRDSHLCSPLLDCYNVLLAVNLLIDTGSSNTWVGADKKYAKTSTSKSTGHQVVS